MFFFNIANLNIYEHIFLHYFHGFILKKINHILIIGIEVFVKDEINWHSSRDTD